MSRSRRRLPRQLELRVESTEKDGAGIAWFKRNNLPPRKVRVKGVPAPTRLAVDVISRRKGEWYALPSEQFSDISRNISCPHFFRCGGCSLQHLSTEQQLELKQQGVLDALAEQGVTAGNISSPVSGPRYLYRRKARLGVRFVPGKGGIVIGFRESFNGRVALLENCQVLAQPFQNMIPLLRKTLNQLSVRERIPQLELVAGDKAAALVIRHLDPFSSADLELLSRCSSQLKLTVYTQDAGADSIQPLNTEVELGYRLTREGLYLKFHPADFVQVNASVNELLVDAAMSLLNIEREDRLLDLFCGLGNFSLPAARRGCRVTGIEVSTEMVHRAHQNAVLNGLSGRIRFFAEDLYSQPLTCLGEYNKVLLDPPRSGAGECLEHLESSPIERVVYVSCYPRSFASDAAALSNRGFQLSQVGIFDMFPHTTHVETLGLFERR